MLQYNEDGGDIRVGEAFQASVPEFACCQRDANDDPKHKKHYRIGASMMWSPPSNLSTEKVTEFVEYSKIQFGYTEEQALGLLFWHKYNIREAIVGLSEYSPAPPKWIPEEEAIFDQAFRHYGKNFHRIRQTLVDKSVGDLVEYYYTWKKIKRRVCLVDKYCKAASVEGNSSHNASVGSSSSSTTTVYESEANVIDETTTLDKQLLPLRYPTTATSSAGGLLLSSTTNYNLSRSLAINVSSSGRAQCEEKCINCLATKTDSGLNDSPLGWLCNVCYIYWR